MIHENLYEQLKYFIIHATLSPRSLHLWQADYHTEWPSEDLKAINFASLFLFQSGDIIPNWSQHGTIHSFVTVRRA